MNILNFNKNNNICHTNYIILRVILLIIIKIKIFIPQIILFFILILLIIIKIKIFKILHQDPIELGLTH